MQSRKKIDVACQIITCISGDSEKATNRAKKTLAFYISVGKIYREFLAKNGFKSLKDGTFDSRVDFQNQTYSFNPTEFLPMYKALSLDIP